MTARDPLSPQWEDCKICGGDHWTKDHPDLRLPPEKREPMPPDRQPTRDTPEAEAVLAAAMRDLYGPDHDPKFWLDDAEFLLAAMPGMTFMPRVATADWTGSTKRDAAEVARLSRIEAAAQAHVAWEYRMPGAPRFTLTMLRAALAKP